jgi:hypothetical protein
MDKNKRGFSYQFTYYSILPYESPEEYFKNYETYDKRHYCYMNPFEHIYREYRELCEILEDGSEITPEYFKIFHRHPESYIGLISKSCGRMKGLGFVKAKEIEDTLDFLNEEHKELIKYDFYFTVNSYYRSKGWEYPETGLKGINRKESNLSYLNTCYVDIDVGRPAKNYYFQDGKSVDSLEYLCGFEDLLGIKKESPDEKSMSKNYTWNQALLASILLQRDEVIPEVSFYAKSGRGLYLFWLLKPGVKALQQNIEKYKAINREIQERISELMFADSIMDAARILRVPGSLHSNNNEYVTYCMHPQNEAPPEYSLDELQNFLELSQKGKKEKESKYLDKAIKKGSAPKRSSGVVASSSNRLEDILKISEHYNGFKHGKRYTSLKIAIRVARLAAWKEKDILRMALDLAAQCDPPYPYKDEANDIPVKKLLEQEFTGRGGLPLALRNDYLANFFEVNVDLAEQLSLNSIRPPGAVRNNVETCKEKNKKLREAIQEAIIEISKEKNCSQNEYLKLLEAEYGISVSKTTLRRNLKALELNGLISLNKKKPGRPPGKNCSANVTESEQP